MGESVSFDRIADRYDDTRGGMERGHAVAEAIDPVLVPGTTLEIGVGTGLIAAGLATRGRSTVGVDLSPAMLAHAAMRLGPRVAVADVLALPMPRASVANVVSSWVLHLVADREVAVAECARVLEPGGRMLVIDARPVWAPDDMLEIQRRTFGFAAQFEIEPLFDIVAFRPVDVIDGELRTIHESPHEVADHIERRDWSSLWEVDADTWAEVVEPVIRDLRALPDPDRQRARSSRHPIHVYERIAPA